MIAPRTAEPGSKWTPSRQAPRILRVARIGRGGHARSGRPPELAKSRMTPGLIIGCRAHGPDKVG
jgi:hypothetical protein